MIFVIRHGERTDHVDDPEENKKIIIKDDPPLTALGHEQAEKCGKRIATLLGDRPTTIYASPFIRTIQTANGIATACGIDKILLCPEVCEGLWAIWFDSDPRPRLHSVEENFTNSVPFEQAQKFKEYEFPESRDQMMDRYRETISHLADKHVDENVVIVTHWFGLQAYTDLYTSEEYCGDPSYTAITAVTNDGGPRNCAITVDISHLT